MHQFFPVGGSTVLRFLIFTIYALLDGWYLFLFSLITSIIFILISFYGIYYFWRSQGSVVAPKVSHKHWGLCRLVNLPNTKQYPTNVTSAVGFVKFSVSANALQHYSFQIGLEVVSFLHFAQDEDNKSFLAFYPQMHIRLTAELQIQFGIGFFFGKEKFTLQLVHRLILATATDHNTGIF